MSLHKLKSITNQTADMLEAEDWTVEKLSIASISDLTVYTGIGRTTAQKIIIEAQESLNNQRLAEAVSLDQVGEIVKSLLDDGLTLQVLALSPVRSLEGHKGISRELAAKIISYAQDKVNEQGLQYSTALDQNIRVNDAPYKNTSAAFPEEWLSGAVEPPAMSARVKRVFEQAKADYEAENG